MLKITVKEYPETFRFTVDKELPAFKYACRVRGGFLLEAMEAQGIDLGHHIPEDFVVEMAKKVRGGEHWYVGS